jgi:hypothetical protein
MKVFTALTQFFMTWIMVAILTVTPTLPSFLQAGPGSDESSMADQLMELLAPEKENREVGQAEEITLPETENTAADKEVFSTQPPLSAMTAGAGSKEDDKLQGKEILLAGTVVTAASIATACLFTNSKIDDLEEQVAALIAAEGVGGSGGSGGGATTPVISFTATVPDALFSGGFGGSFGGQLKFYGATPPASLFHTEGYDNDGILSPVTIATLDLDALGAGVYDLTITFLLSGSITNPIDIDVVVTVDNESPVTFSGTVPGGSPDGTVVTLIPTSSVPFTIP